jgi:hypothetical protein
MSTVWVKTAMPIISGVTPPSLQMLGLEPQQVLRDNKMALGASPAPPYDPMSGEIYSAVGPPPAAIREAVQPLCSNWCVWNWTAMAHAGISTQPECTSRCLYQNNATVEQVVAWGYPSLMDDPAAMPNVDPYSGPTYDHRTTPS